MTQSESFYPQPKNLGKNCSFWNVSGVLACSFPKLELQGRTSCEGIVDDVCLFVKDGRVVTSMTPGQQQVIRTQVPTVDSPRNLPPGNII